MGGRSCRCVLAAADCAQVRRRPLDRPSPLCQLPPPRRCRRRTALQSPWWGPSSRCVPLLDGRSETAPPRGWPELPVRAGCCSSRSGTSQTALDGPSPPCQLLLPPASLPSPFLPPFLPPSSLRPSLHRGQPGGSRFTGCSSGACTGALDRRETLVKKSRGLLHMRGCRHAPSLNASACGDGRARLARCTSS